MESQVGSILTQYIPSLDKAVQEYCLSILCDESNEFGGQEDVYEAVGDVISSAVADIEDDSVQAICTALAKLLVKESAVNGSGKIEFTDEHGHRVLPGAVDMAKTTATPEPELTSIFMVKKEEKSNVDAKKLAKAEEKIREKKEKRILADGRLPKPIASINVTATASQSLQKAAAVDDNTGDIRLYNVDVSFGEKQLLVNADLTLAQGKRYGLVGRNGIGKTTFFKMLSSKQLQIPAKIRLLHVEQEVVGDDRTVLQSVLEADTRREELLRLEKELSRQIAGGQNDENTTSQLSEIYAELEARESAKAPAVAAKILAGLGFPEPDQVPATLCGPRNNESGFLSDSDPCYAPA